MHLSELDWKSKKLTAAFISLIFLLSIMVRLPLLGRPLSVHHEWLTSTSLRHIQIFYENGASRYHFSPVLNYSAPGDKYIREGYVHSDNYGNTYYLSFPPLAFLLPYFSFKLLHIYPSVLALQIYNLFFHFLSAWMIFFVVNSMMQKTGSRDSRPALFAYFLYLFFPAALWFQGNVYMSDMAIQPFFIAVIACFWIWLTDEKKRPVILPISGLLLFLASYTEWLGVFAGFTLFCYGIWNWKKKGSVILALTAAVSVTAAFALTVYQYASINGLEPYISYAVSKFLFRTGDIAHASNGLHVLNPNAWLNILVNYIGGYLPYFFVLGWLFFRKSKNQTQTFFGENGNSVKTLLWVSIIPVLLHHAVFFNFTSIHDFAALKAAPFLALLGGVLLGFYLNSPEFEKHRKRWLIYLSAAFIAGIAMFYAINLYGAHPYYKQIGEAIGKEAKPDEVIFVRGNDFSLDPQYFLYAHRNLAPWEGMDKANELIRQNGCGKGILFTVNPKTGTVNSFERFIPPEK